MVKLFFGRQIILAITLPNRLHSFSEFDLWLAVKCGEREKKRKKNRLANK